MIKLFFTLILLLLMGNSYAASLSDLIRDLRHATGELTDTTSFYTDSTANRWINLAQDRIVTLGGFIPKQVDFTFNRNDTTYTMPSDFRMIDGDKNIAIHENSISPLWNNPGFKKDTTLNQYFIGWKDEDTAKLYIRGTYLVDDDLLRIFYLGTAADMAYDTSTCEVPDNLQGYIIEEAFSYYIRSQKRFQEASLIQSLIRQDMGIVKKQ